MRRLIPIILVAALFFPGVSIAKGKKSHKAKARGNTPEWAVETDRCSGDKDMPSAALGKEKIFLNEGMSSASFSKDELHTFKHDLYYSCPTCDVHKRGPGACSACSGELKASFKHGDTWHVVSRDLNSALVIDGVAGAPPAEPAVAPIPSQASCDMSADCPKMTPGECKHCKKGKKWAKKSKGKHGKKSSKKHKKVEKEAAAEPAAAEPVSAAEPAAEPTK
ncbi:hypothetical protein HYY75_07625 [bacterium]|nr:hypothetical protein [bacterium]